MIQRKQSLQAIFHRVNHRSFPKFSLKKNATVLLEQEFNATPNKYQPKYVAKCNFMKLSPHQNTAWFGNLFTLLHSRYTLLSCISSLLHKAAQTQPVLLTKPYLMSAQSKILGMNLLAAVLLASSPLQPSLFQEL